jgi:hypothetical protein
MEGVWLAQSAIRTGVGLWRAYVAVIPIALFFLAITLAVKQRGRRSILWAFAASAAILAAMLTVNLH